MKKSKHPEQATDYPLVLFTSPDGEVTVPTRLEHDTVWLTQEQMAQVFDVKRPAVTKHLANIFKTGELDQESVRSILEHMGQDGVRSYTTRHIRNASNEREMCEYQYVQILHIPHGGRP